MAEELPGIRRRLASMLYEALLLVGVLAALFLLPHVALGSVTGVFLPGTVLVLHIFVLLAGYFLWHWHHGGQTLAMQTWKTQLLSTRGRVPTWRQLALRYLLAWPSLMLYGAGVFWALLDRDRQFLHDRLAGTRIAFKR